MLHRQMLILLIILIACSLCSCSGQAKAPPAVAATTVLQPSPMQTQKPAPALSASATPPPSATKQPTAVVEKQVLPIQQVTTNCLEWVEWDPSHLSSDSILFFVDFNPESRKKSFSAYSPHIGQMEPLFELPGYLDSFGPPTNTKRFAYRDDHMQVIFVNANGEAETVWPFKSYWHSSLAWLDDESLLVSYDPTATVEKNVDILNALTGETQQFSPERSDVFTYQIEDTGHFVWKLVYDPTRTRLIYTRETEAHEAVITMVNVDNGEILWELERASTGLDNPPLWSPDGSSAAVIASGDPEFDYQNFEIYLVDRDGKAWQWVDLQQVPGITADDYQWSPDGRYLAVYGSSIYILDTQEQRFVDSCVPLSENGFYFGPVAPILWSPNSQKVIYQRENAPAVVVDLTNRTVSALTVDKYFLPVSWLSQAP